MIRPIEILLAEDRPDDAILTEEVLIEAGINFNLQVVSDGLEAISYLQDAFKGNVASPDIVLLDLNMPKSSGHDVLRNMRKALGIEDMPVVVLTVSIADQDITQAMNTGMNFYLRKPARAETLGPLVQRVVDLWSQE